MQLNIATNNGDIGGGEVMLFNIARAARSGGHHVTIVAPAEPAEVAEAAQDEGFDTVVLPVRDRKQYMAALRVWDARQRQGVLWANGLVPSVATAGHKNRIVHLHQLPRSTAQKLLVGPARRGASATLLPSKFAAERFKDAAVFYNWVEAVDLPLTERAVEETVRVGFVGRPSFDKGTDVLADAIQELNRDVATRSSAAKYQLVLAGEPKFVEEDGAREIADRLKELGDSVVSLGWLPPAELLKQVDMLVVPSVVKETFGLVAAEAMSARVPLIVSDAGALPEVVGEAHPFIAKKGSVSDLAAMIASMASQLHTKDDTVGHSVADAYWRWYEVFSPEAGRQRVSELLNSLEDGVL